MNRSENKSLPRRTLAVTKSARPKEFQRDEVLVRDELQTFLKNSTNLMKSGSFNQIHNHCLSSDFEIFHYEQIKKQHEQEKKEYQDKLEKRDHFRQNLLENNRTRKSTNFQQIETIKKNWWKTQNIKKSRQIHDLQFEITTQKIAELKHAYDKLKNQEIEKNGINEFEKIMKRSGIGQSNESSKQMTISYEDPKLFKSRLAKMAGDTMPTDGEVADFMLQLKQRTKDKSLARYEQARRRRRAALEQSKANLHEEDK